MNIVETKSLNSRGTPIRRVQVVERNRVVELCYQQVHGQWFQYKRQTIWKRNIH